jgi:hypothetical protein
MIGLNAYNQDVMPIGHHYPRQRHPRFLRSIAPSDSRCGWAVRPEAPLKPNRWSKWKLRFNLLEALVSSDVESRDSGEKVCERTRQASLKPELDEGR